MLHYFVLYSQNEWEQFGYCYFRYFEKFYYCCLIDLANLMFSYQILVTAEFCKLDQLFPFSTLQFHSTKKRSGGRPKAKHRLKSTRMFRRQLLNFTPFLVLLMADGLSVHLMLTAAHAKNLSKMARMYIAKPLPTLRVELSVNLV